jgi:hypothetical protein
MGCRGRFDVFEDDNDLESPGWHGLSKSEHRKGDGQEQIKKDVEERDQRNLDEKECREDKREQKLSEEDRDESRKCFSGPLVPERGRDGDRDRSLLSLICVVYIYVDDCRLEQIYHG